MGTDAYCPLVKKEYDWAIKKGIAKELAPKFWS